MMLFELLGNSAASSSTDNGCHASEGKQYFLFIFTWCHWCGLFWAA